MNKKVQSYTHLGLVTRVEIIDETGRAYVNMACKQVHYMIQDDGRTLKIFLKNEKE